MPLDAQQIIVDYRVGMKYADFVKAAERLIVSHWNEVGSFRNKLQLNPDHARYLGLEKNGNLHIITAWANDVLIAYLFLLIGKHPRDQSKLASAEDIIYVSPPFRRYRVGVKLRKYAEDLSRQFGCVLAMRLEKARRRNHRSPEREGYKLYELVYVKELE